MLKRKNLTLKRPEEKVLDVPLMPGWKTGTKLTFEGEGDEYSPGRCQVPMPVRPTVAVNYAVSLHFASCSHDWLAAVSVSRRGRAERGGRLLRRLLSDYDSQDLVFFVAAMPHKSFTRAGSDLVYHSCIPLVDALTGFTVEVPTLDNRILQVAVRDVVHPKYTQVIKGEGMPISKEPGTRGDLILTFDIVWPVELDDDHKQALRTFLPREQ